MKLPVYIIGSIAAAAVAAHRAEPPPRSHQSTGYPSPTARAPSPRRRASRAGSRTRSPAGTSSPVTCACTPSSAATARRCS